MIGFIVGCAVTFVVSYATMGAGAMVAANHLCKKHGETPIGPSNWKETLGLAALWPLLFYVLMEESIEDVSDNRFPQPPQVYKSFEDWNRH